MRMGLEISVNVGGSSIRLFLLAVFIIRMLFPFCPSTMNTIFRLSSDHVGLRYSSNSEEINVRISSPEFVSISTIDE